MNKTQKKFVSLGRKTLAIFEAGREREESLVPTCPKCNKVPLKCPYPDNCGMEKL